MAILAILAESHAIQSGQPVAGLTCGSSEVVYPECSEESLRSSMPPRGSLRLQLGFNFGNFGIYGNFGNPRRESQIVQSDSGGGGADL